MKYTAGQKVQILPDLTSGYDQGYGDTYCNSEMVRGWAGKVVTLNRENRSNVWSIKEDGGNWDWNVECSTSRDKPDDAFKQYLNVL
jgi:hypothetical protein